MARYSEWLWFVCRHAPSGGRDTRGGRDRLLAMMMMVVVVGPAEGQTLACDDWAFIELGEGVPCIQFGAVSGGRHGSCLLTLTAAVRAAQISDF